MFVEQPLDSQGLYLTDPVYPGLFYKHLRHSLIDRLIYPFPPNLQNIMNPKQLKVGLCKFDTMFTTCHISYVTFHVSHVTYHIFFFLIFFFLQIGAASWWRVWYQHGLPRLVSLFFFRISGLY